MSVEFTSALEFTISSQRFYSSNLPRQNCAYWNYSGRAMFYNALQKNGLI